MIGKKRRTLLTPPSGLEEKDVAVEKSVCTGEAVVGFREPGTGRLLQAVAVQSRKDLEEFYRSYGFSLPKD